jgi:Mg-chelatase subunit ChlD
MMRCACFFVVMCLVGCATAPDDPEVGPVLDWSEQRWDGGSGADSGQLRSAIEVDTVPEPWQVNHGSIFADNGQNLELGMDDAGKAIEVDGVGCQLAYRQTEGRHFVQVQLHPDSDVANWAQEAVDLVLVVDVSGSMNRSADGINRMDLVREVVRNLLSGLAAGSRVGLVLCRHEATLEYPIAAVGDQAALINQVLQGVRPGNRSRLDRGVSMGFQVLGNVDTPGRPRLVLLTDSDDNDDVENETELVQQIKSAHAAGLATTVCAVGNDFQQAFADQVRALSGGQYFSIRWSGDIQRWFGRDLHQWLHPFLSDYEMELELANGVRLVHACGTSADDGLDSLLDVDELPDGPWPLMELPTVLVSDRPGTLLFELEADQLLWSYNEYGWQIYEPLAVAALGQLRLTYRTALGSVGGLRIDLPGRTVDPLPPPPPLDKPEQRTEEIYPAVSFPLILLAKWTDRVARIAQLCHEQRDENNQNNERGIFYDINGSPKLADALDELSTILDLLYWLGGKQAADEYAFGDRLWTIVTGTVRPQPADHPPWYTPPPSEDDDTPPDLGTPVEEDEDQPLEADT